VAVKYDRYSPVRIPKGSMETNIMLVLSRKVGEQIVIDGNITLIINRIDGNRVSIAIEAPKDVKILRSELAPKKKTDEEAA
jgi:carbon storage regulator